MSTMHSCHHRCHRTPPSGRLWTHGSAAGTTSRTDWLAPVSSPCEPRRLAIRVEVAQMLVVTLIAGALATVSGGYALRGYTIERRNRALNAPVRGVPERSLRNLRWRSDVAASVAAATALDLSIALVRIDPQLLDAIDRAHGANAFESFTTLQQHVSAVMSRGEDAFAGLVSQYKGSLTELLAADHLTAAGHAVELADLPNQPGWDAIVDGAPIQIKGGLDDQAITDALAEHPDIPVFTVSEHADAFGDASVTALPLSGQEIAETTEVSLDAIDGVGDLLPELPLVTTAIELMRNVDACSRGEIGVGGVVARTAITTTGAGVGAWIGGMVIPIPVLGSAIGAMVGRFIARGAMTDEPATMRVVESPAARARRESQRATFAAESAPLLAELGRALLQWRVRAIHAMHAGAEQARAAAARTTVAPRWTDALLPRRKVVIARVARERFEAEADAFEALASVTASRRDVRAIHRLWQTSTPRLDGVDEVDARITALVERLTTLARRLQQGNGHWWAGRRSPPQPLVVTTAAVPEDTRWSRLLMPTTLLVLLAVGATAIAEPSRAHPNPPTGRTAYIPAQPTPALAAPPPASTEAVHVAVPRCRVRSGPELAAAIVGRETAGRTCELVRWSGDWAQVRCEATAGYMHRGCLVR
ncbi:MAG: hypothetical protein H6701_11205 [Myxococcales bacterium]|nr:hypothetical protein [Myxococcales bacterium]